MGMKLERPARKIQCRRTQTLAVCGSWAGWYAKGSSTFQKLDSCICAAGLTQWWLACPCWVAKSCLTLCSRLNLPGFSVHGISQARILEWDAIPFSRGFSWPRDGTMPPALAGRFFTTEPPGRPWWWLLHPYTVWWRWPRMYPSQALGTTLAPTRHPGSCCSWAWGEGSACCPLMVSLLLSDFLG